MTLSSLLFRPAALAFACLLAISGCGLRSQSESERLASARADLDARNYRTAVVTLKEALQKNETLAEARHLLGRASQETGDQAGAVLELRKALSLGHDPNASVPMLARALLALGKPQDLISELGTKTLTQPRAQAELQTMLAMARAAARDPAGADDALRAAVEADPGYGPPRLLQARAVAGKGRFDDAIAQVQEVLNADPRSVDGWMLRGELLQFGKSDPAGAAAAYNRVLEVEPRHLMAHSALVALALQVGPRADATARLAALQKVWPDHPRTLMLQARVALAGGEQPAARAAVQQLLRATPTDPRALLLAGEIELRGGAWLLAQSHLKNALTLAPRAVPVRVLLAQAQTRGGDGAAALATLAPLLREAAPPAEALSVAALAHLLLGQSAPAQGLLERAAKARPQDARYRTTLALFPSGRADGARELEQLETLAAADGSGFTEFALVNSLIVRRDFAAALKALDRVEKKLPTNPMVPLVRGQVLEALRQPAPARLAYEQAHRLAPTHLGAVLALADRDLADGQPQAALQRLQALVAASPGDARVRLALAGLQRRTGAKQALIQTTIEQAQKASPGDPTPALALVQHHLGAGASQLALTAARSALVAFPGEVEVIDALGQAQLAAAEPQQAVNSFKQVVAAQPKNALALVRLAQAQRATKDVGRARASLNDALALTPDLLEAHQELLELALSEKQWAVALEIARQRQLRMPARHEGWEWEAAVHGAQRRWAPAIVALRQAIAKGGGTEVAIKLFDALQASGQSADAARQAGDWIAAHPKDIAFRMHLGDRAVGRGDLPAAEGHFRSVADLAPEFVPALNNLAWVLARQSKPGGAALAERANQLAPDQPELMDTWATALAAENELAKAYRLQKQAVERAPARPHLRLNLARLALQSGDKGTAREELKRLSALGPEFGSQAEVAALMKTLQ